MSKVDGPTKKKAPLIQRNHSLPIQMSHRQPAQTGFFDLPSGPSVDDDSIATQSHSAPGTMQFQSRSSNNSSRTSKHDSDRDTKSSVPPLTAPCWFTLPTNETAYQRREIDPQVITLIALFKMELSLVLIDLKSSSTTAQASSAEQSTSSAKPILRGFSLTKNTPKREILQEMLTGIDRLLDDIDMYDGSSIELAVDLKKILAAGLDKLKKRREIHSETTHQIKMKVEGFIDELNELMTTSEKSTTAFTAKC